MAVDSYARDLAAAALNGGGSKGPADYNDLSNKPSINGVELIGNKSKDDLGISSIYTLSIDKYPQDNPLMLDSLNYGDRVIIPRDRNEKGYFGITSSSGNILAQTPTSLGYADKDSIMEIVYSKDREYWGKLIWSVDGYPDTKEVFSYVILKAVGESFFLQSYKKQDVGTIMSSDVAATISSKHTYNTLPETSKVPTNDKQFTNKKYVDDQIKEVEMYKFPNMTIIGNPTINNGQISDFTSQDYLMFPFLVDFNDRPFEINMMITTGDNVTAQENIIDSEFGLAFAISNSHFILAISTNGTSWDLGANEGTYTVLPNTSYRIKLSWDGSAYKLSYSTDGGTTYTDDISVASFDSPYPKQIYAGVSIMSGNHFTGIINLNYADLKIDGILAWMGMDDVGIATRADINLSNLSLVGEEKIKSLAGGGAKTYILNDVNYPKESPLMIKDLKIGDLIVIGDSDAAGYLGYDNGSRILTGQFMTRGNKRKWVVASTGAERPSEENPLTFINTEVITQTHWGSQTSQNGFLYFNCYYIRKLGGSDYDVYTLYMDTIDVLKLLNSYGTQTITGQFTYNVLPMSSVAPTDDRHLVNKKYVDENAGGGEVVEIGQHQYTYNSKVLPAIQVEDLRTIYNKDKNAKLQILHWTLYGTENNLKVVSSDHIGENYSIDVLVHNQYHCEYVWTDETEGIVNPTVYDPVGDIDTLLQDIDSGSGV